MLKFADKNASNDQRITGTVVLSRMTFNVNGLMHSSSNRELFVFFIETKTNKSRILKNKPTKKKKSNNTHTHAHTQKPTCTKKTNNQVKNRN